MLRRSRSLLWVVLFAPALAVLAACSQQQSAPATLEPGTASSIDWSDCSDGFQCASMAVPLDSNDPSGATISIALIRLPAADASKRIASLLVNPGGPGGSGVDLVREGAQDLFSQEIRDRFDIVGFDPRGVGASTPAVHCVDDLGGYIAGVQGDTTEQRNLARLADAEFAKACGEHSAGILGYLSAPHVARDMEAIRVALGDSKLTYVGFSYGTLLGATYADLYPDSVRAFVLDGALDPSLTPEEQGNRQDDGFDTALDAFLTDCAERDSCPFHSGGDPGKAFDELLSNIEHNPLPATALHDTRTVNSDVAWTGVSAALYSQAQGWPRLASALALAARDGDGSGLLALADHYDHRDAGGGYTNEFEANVAINCVDAPHNTTPTHATPTAGDASGTPTKEPLSSPCDFWPVKPDRTPAAIKAKGAPWILVIGTTGDPATPYREAQALSEQLRSGRLVTYHGEGHTAYGGINSCIDKIVEAYLVRLQLPPQGTECGSG